MDTNTSPVIINPSNSAETSVESSNREEDIGPQTIDFNPPFRSKISRLFIFRPLWVFILMFPLMIRSFWINIIMLVHILFKFLMGRRCKSFWESEVKFTRYIVKWQLYFNGIIDKRPDFTKD